MNIEDLKQLNEEILALTRAGVPLGPGLLQTASNRSVPKRLQRITQSVGKRLQRGESMEQALHGSRDSIPPVYAALVEAGTRSGNLPVALESMSEHLRRVDQLRKLTISSLVYPIILVILACGGFAICISPTLAGIESLLETSRIDAPALKSIVRGLRAAAPWIAVLPAVLVVVCCGWWVLTRRASAASAPTAAKWFGWVPGTRKIIRSGSRAVFANLLHVMAKQQVPMEHAITLAAEATGDPDLIHESRTIATGLERGTRWTPEATPPRRRPAIPGTIRWLIEAARSPEELSTGLKQLADTYLRQVHSHEIWTRTVFPVLATVLVGGTVTVAYATAMMGPWMSSLWQLSQP